MVGLHVLKRPKMISDGAWSLAGNVANALAAFAVVKAISSMVPAGDYGQASLVLGLVALLTSLLAGPLLTAHLRLYFDYLDRGLSTWFASKFNRLMMAAVVCMLAMYLGVAAAYYALGQRLYVDCLLPAAFLLMTQPVFSASTNYLEAHRFYRRLAVTNLLSRAFHPVFLFVLLIAGVGAAHAIVLSQGLAAACLLFRSSRVVDTHQGAVHPESEADSTEFDALKRSFLSFGWALPIGYVANWTLSTADRYIIGQFMTLRDVGVYALNYGFWSMPYLVLNGWLEVATRSTLYHHAAAKNWPQLRRIVLLRLLLATGMCCVGTLFVYLLSERIAPPLLGERYWHGRELVMYIAVGHCFLVIGYSLHPLFLALKSPISTTAAAAAAASVNILLNVLLVPAWGLSGAGASTLAGYLLWAALLAMLAARQLRAIGR